MPDLETPQETELQYIFTYSPADESKAFKGERFWHRLIFGTSFLFAIFASLLFLYSMKRFVELGETNTVFLTTLAITSLATFVVGGLWGKPYESLLGAETKFDPIEVTAIVNQNGVSNITPFKTDIADWGLVEIVKVFPYGIAFKTVSSQWFIPSSAFATNVEMHQEFKKIKAIWKQGT